MTTTLDAKARLGLTLIAGGAVANIYYNQPLLGLIVAEFGDRAALWVPTTALVGYGLGIVGLVPLGDALPRRTLIVGQCLGLALALLAVGLAPNLASLALHDRMGFRRIGHRERIARMTYGPWAGEWRDTVLVERRRAA